MEITNKLIYDLTMMQMVMGESDMGDSFYGGLRADQDGVLQVKPYNEATDIMRMKPDIDLLTTITNNSNTLLTLANILIGLGVIIATISVVYSGIQFANSTSALSKEKAKKRLTFSIIGVALLGALGLLVRFSFSFFK